MVIAVRTRQACCVIVSRFKEEIETLHSIAQAGRGRDLCAWAPFPFPLLFILVGEFKEEIETLHSIARAGRHGKGRAGERLVSFAKSPREAYVPASGPLCLASREATRVRGERRAHAPGLCLRAGKNGFCLRAGARIGGRSTFICRAGDTGPGLRRRAAHACGRAATRTHASHAVAGGRPSTLAFPVHPPHDHSTPPLHPHPPTHSPIPPPRFLVLSLPPPARRRSRRASTRS